MWVHLERNPLGCDFIKFALRSGDDIRLENALLDGDNKDMFDLELLTAALSFLAAFLAATTALITFVMFCIRNRKRETDSGRHDDDPR